MATEARGQSHILVVGSASQLVCMLAERFARRGHAVSVVVEASADSVAQSLKKKFPSRVQVHNGGSSRIDFGVSGQAYQDLAEQLTTIVDLDPLGTGPDSFFAPAAAFPGRELVELARSTEKRIRVIALSSVMVAGNFKGVFAEHDVAPNGAIREPFAAKLAHKERILRRFSADLSIDILRAGWVVGDQPGLCPLVPLLFGLDEQRLEAVTGQVIPLASLDSLFDLIEHRALVPDEHNSQIFHLFERQVAPVESLHATLLELAAGFAPRAFDLSRGAQRILAGEALQGWDLDHFWQLHPRRTRFSERATERYLEANELTLPRIDKQLLRRLVSRAVEEMGGFR